MIRREVVADWIQIVTGPLTVLSVYWAWTDRLKNTSPTVAPTPTLSLAPYAIAISLIALLWIFFFSIFVRLLSKWMAASNGEAFLYSFLAIIFGLVFFIPAELLFLEATLPQSPSQIELALWTLLPVFLWIFATVCALVLAS